MMTSDTTPCNVESDGDGIGAGIQAIESNNECFGPDLRNMERERPEGSSQILCLN